jgi:hypothetical protein
VQEGSHQLVLVLRLERFLQPELRSGGVGAVPLMLDPIVFYFGVGVLLLLLLIATD